MSYKWISFLGEFEHVGNNIIYKGKPFKYIQPPDIEEYRPSFGKYISDQKIVSGNISAEIEFENLEESLCSIIINNNPLSGDFLIAGIEQNGFTLSGFQEGKWNVYSHVPSGASLKSKRKYKIYVIIKGSSIRIEIDDIEIIYYELPYKLIKGNTGIWCRSNNNITISNFTVKYEKPKVFVVMQFTEPYNELYKNVIEKICNEFGLEAYRADDTYGPGLIIADITKQIIESNMIIAEITPDNPNVYYEVGYAHGLNKPTILISEKNRKLPFDVSPFRTLFYENTISGKEKIEVGLRKHIAAIINN